MRQTLKWLGGALALALLVPAGHVRADYLIPYELRIHQRGGGYTQYSVIVSLADHYRYYFGPQDGLSHFLVANEYRGQHEYLDYAFNWYLEYVRNSDGLYGEGAETIAAGRRRFESISDGFSSAVTLTEYKKPKNILGMLRTSVPDGAGLTPVERHYWDLGLNQESFPPLGGMDFSPYEDVLFQPSPFNRNGMILNADVPKRSGTWPSGGKVELKNLGIPNGLFKRVFPFLYLTGRMHKMYSFDGRPIPASVSHWPNGLEITPRERQFLGRRVSQICLEATGEKLKSMYESLLGVEVWKTLQNEHTGNQAMHFMHGDLLSSDAKVENTIRAMTRGYPKVWLYYDAKLAQELHSCPRRLAGEGK